MMPRVRAGEVGRGGGRERRDKDGCGLCFFFQAEDGIRDLTVTGVQTCALPILVGRVGFADQAMPPVASADADLESAVRLRVRGQQLDANLSGGTPGPPRGGKRSEERSCRERV